MFKLFFAVLAATTVAENHAKADWRCRNANVEIQCTEKLCEVINPEETSTMSLSFNNDGEFSVCAYSGCWTGKGTVLLQDSFLIISKENATWSFPSSNDSNAQDIFIALDLKDKVAVLKAGAYAHPFNCLLVNHD